MTGTAPTSRQHRTFAADPRDAGIDVDVWSTRVDRQAVGLDAIDLLDAAELARAARFRFERDRDRFVARRVFLRRILAGYTDVDPSAVAYLIGSHGKPDLALTEDVRFSATHSDALAVVAVVAVPGGRAVGVDVERVRPMPDAMDLARAHCTEREREMLRSVPGTARSEAFLTLWTRKEALAKALGTGLSSPLDAFDVATCDGPVGRPLGPMGDLPFVLANLDGLTDHVGSVVVEGTSIAVRQRDLDAIAA